MSKEELKQLNQKIKAIKAKKDAAAAEHARLVKQKASEERKEAAHREWERLWKELKSLYAKKKELIAKGKGVKKKVEGEKPKDRKAQYKSFLEAKPAQKRGKKIGEGITGPSKIKMTDGSNAVAKKHISALQYPGAIPAWGNEVDIDNEVLAYKLDELLGLDVVPATKLEEFSGEKRSFQLWIENSTSLYKSKFFDMQRASTDRAEEVKRIFDKEGLSHDEMTKALVLNYLMQGHDLHEGNIIFDENKKIYAIDNGFAGPKLGKYNEWGERDKRKKLIDSSTEAYRKIKINKDIVEEISKKLKSMTSEEIKKAIYSPDTYSEYDEKGMMEIAKNIKDRGEKLASALSTASGEAKQKELLKLYEQRTKMQENFPKIPKDELEAFNRKWQDLLLKIRMLEQQLR